MRPRISIRGSVRPSVRLSVRHYFVETREIDIIEQISAKEGLAGSLEASQHLYKSVHPPIGFSVHQSVCQISVK